MTLDFKSLKKNSQQTLEELKKYTETLNNTSYSNNTNEDFWYPELDKTGNGYAVIRFLPAPAVDGDDGVPFIKMFSFGFEGPSGKWLIEKSLTTIGQKCPVVEYNSKLWKQSDDEKSPTRLQARKQKRKLQYYVNVFIVEDPANPSNNGKVKLFKMGKKIFDKIEEKMYPEKLYPENYKGKIPDAINPFDLWEGANFELRIRKVDGNINYDLSKFLDVSPLAESDDEIKLIWESEHSLQKFLQPDQFLSYDELKNKLYEVLDLNEPSEEVREEIAAKTDFGKKLKEKPFKEPTKAVSDEDDSFDEEFFNNLAK